MSTRDLQLLDSDGQLKLLERHAIVTPLGIRFVDAMTGRTVGGGLDVWTWPEDAPQARRPVRATSSGIHAAHRLPGLLDFEQGAGDAAFWAAAPAAVRRVFVVEARDLEGRFLPLQARVAVPAQGFVSSACASLLPAECQDAVPLFSAPARRVAGAVASIRADLWDVGVRRQAAWAVVDAAVDGRPVARGMADAQGQLALFFAYPEPPAMWASPPIGSPAVPPRVPLADQRWDVDLTVRYARRAGVAPVPDLCDALRQPPAELVADAMSPAPPMTRVVLRYGEGAVLRTANTGDADRGRVWVMTAGSPS
jgi:hypothetical protein